MPLSVIKYHNHFSPPYSKYTDMFRLFLWLLTRRQRLTPDRTRYARATALIDPGRVAYQMLGVVSVLVGVLRVGTGF